MPVESLSAVTRVETGNRVLSCSVSTLAVVPLIICEVSFDRGVTWQEIGRSTAVTPAPPPHYPDLPILPPGFTISLIGVTRAAHARVRVVADVPHTVTCVEQSRADAKVAIRAKWTAAVAEFTARTGAPPIDRDAEAKSLRQV